MSYAGWRYSGRRASTVTTQLEPEPTVHELYRIRGSGCRIVVVVATATAAHSRDNVTRRMVAIAPGHLYPSGPRAPVPGREHGHGAQAGEQVGPAFFPVGRLVLPSSSLSLSAASFDRRVVAVVVRLLVFLPIVVFAVVTVTGVREIWRDRRQPESSPGYVNEIFLKTQRPHKFNTYCNRKQPVPESNNRIRIGNQNRQPV